MRCFLLGAILPAVAVVPALHNVNATEADQPKIMASGWTTTGCKTPPEWPLATKGIVVRLLVAPDGSVLAGNVAFSTGRPDLEKAVVDAFSRCHFTQDGDRKEPQWAMFPWPLSQVKPDSAPQQKTTAIAVVQPHAAADTSSSSSTPPLPSVAEVNAAIDAFNRVNCRKPQYPPESKQKGEQGKVTIGFLIGSDGVVQDSKIVASSGFSQLDQAALTELAKCRYRPTAVDGKLVSTASWMTLRYTWTLQ